MTEPSEPADAVIRSAVRAALLRMVPPGVFCASIIAVSSGEGSGGCNLVTYSLAGASGVLRLSGSPPVVLRGSDWRPARHAFRVVLCAIGVAAVAVYALVRAYSSQHEWFARHGHGVVVGVLGLLGVVAMVPAVYGALLPREVWNIRTVWAPALVAIGLALAASIACHVAGPSSRDALSRLHAGDQTAASLEARALIASGVDERGGHAVLDTLHLQQARATRSVEEIARLLRETWYDDVARREAIALLDDHVRNDTAAAYAAADASALDRIADVADSFVSGSGITPRALGHLVRAKACSAQSDWGCAGSEMGAASAAPAAEAAATRDAVAQSARNELQRLSGTVAPSVNIRAQRDRLNAMIAAAKCAMDLTGQPTQPALSNLQAALAPVQQQAVFLDKREAAAAEAKRRQQEALDNQRRAQEASAQRAREAQEHEASRVVLCSDGSYSGCLCHADSHRGCCSHHGGIAGCAP